MIGMKTTNLEPARRLELYSGVLKHTRQQRDRIGSCADQRPLPPNWHTSLRGEKRKNSQQEQSNQKEKKFNLDLVALDPA